MSRKIPPPHIAGEGFSFWLNFGKILIMENKKRLIIPLGILIIIAIFGGWYVYNDFYGDGEKNKNDENNALLNLPIGQDWTISEEKPSDDVLKNQQPDLVRKFYVMTNLPEDIQEQTQQEMQTITQGLSENYNQPGLWIQLGLLRKLIGDYSGAKEAWEYACLLKDSDFVCHANLGDLYAYYLADGVKAEQNFLKAIQISPNQPYLYEKTYEFYRYVLKNDAKAKDILKKGIEANPESSQELQKLLNNY